MPLTCLLLAILFTLSVATMTPQADDVQRQNVMAPSPYAPDAEIMKLTVFMQTTSEISLNGR